MAVDAGISFVGLFVLIGLATIFLTGFVAIVRAIRRCGHNTASATHGRCRGGGGWLFVVALVGIVMFIRATRVQESDRHGSALSAFVNHKFPQIRQQHARPMPEVHSIEIQLEEVAHEHIVADSVTEIVIEKECSERPEEAGEASEPEPVPVQQEIVADFASASILSDDMQSRLIEASGKRPDWLDEASPHHTGRMEGDDYVIAISAEAASGVQELQRKLLQAAANRTHDYLNQLVSDAHHGIRLPWEFLERQFQNAEHYAERREIEVGVPSKKMEVFLGWTRLKFDSAARREMEQLWQQAVAKRRITLTGWGAGMVLSILSVVFAYLKLDTATGGYYTWRLRFLGTGMILALGFAGLMILDNLADWF